MDAEDVTNEALKEIFSKVTGGHEEIVCHPKSQEAEGVNKTFANLVDAGILLEIGNRYFACYPPYNSFSVKGQVVSLKEIEEDIAPCYEFIEVNASH